MGYSSHSHYKAETADRALNRRFTRHLPPSLCTTLVSSSDWVDKSTPYLDIQGSCGRRHRVSR